ncbi:MAG: NRAMP family divalent metal transporter [Planctomycetota bacterium]|jgi:Mn2+/Fe2+ NRAMP family transporter
MRESRSFLKTLGPGLLFAGASVGVSHLVQSTRAGATFGLGLVGIVIFANVFKYPAFSFGPRYAAATGTSMLEGYRRQGKWALVLYTIMTVGTMFTIQAAVTVVTGGLMAALFGATQPILGMAPHVAFSGLLTVICAGIVSIGHYKWLDKIIKAVVAILTVTTLITTMLIIPDLPWDSFAILPSSVQIEDAMVIVAIVTLIGFMPSAIDISVLHSLWTLARSRETGSKPGSKLAMLDFNIGYIATAILGVCFVFLGAAVMFQSGQEFSPSAGVFAGQIISLYTAHLGDWTRPIIATAAFTVMFSTTMVVVDAYPRMFGVLINRFKGEETPWQPDATSRKIYWVAIVIMAVGSLLIVRFMMKDFLTLIDIATGLTFLTAPVLSLLNHRAMLSEAVPKADRPGKAMVVYSLGSIGISGLLAVYFVYVKWLS